MADQDKLTIADLHTMRENGEPIACLTAYDATFARVCEEAGVDVLLAGDSLGMVIQGHATTIPVTLDDVIYHARCVARAARRVFVMADMPFMSAATPDAALRHAMRLMQDAGVQGVKIEVGKRQMDAIGLLHDNGIPVCAHLGLRPQFIHRFGTLKQQVFADHGQLRDLAFRSVDQGARLLLLECVPEDVASEICETVQVPAIGIGVRHACHGQILVMHDVLGVGNAPKFARDFTKGRASVRDAFGAYVKAVKDRDFPEV